MFFGVRRKILLCWKVEEISLSDLVGFTPQLLFPKGFIQLKTGWSPGAWLQWLYKNLISAVDLNLRVFD